MIKNSLIIALCGFFSVLGSGSAASKTQFIPGIAEDRMKEEAPTLNEKLESEILSMASEDILLRTGNLSEMSQNWDKIAEIDRKHNSRLKEIISEFGWPGLSLVGTKGSSNMWLLVQHQDADLEFQKTCLELLKNAVEKQEASPRDFAYLFDRVCMNDGKPQVYGTQWMQKDGKLGLYVVENRDNLNLKRHEIGLGSIEEYKEQMKQGYHLEDKDFE